MKRWIALVAGGMVVLYTALAIGAAGCLFVQAEGPVHAHHSPSHAAHSTLCAWACQVNPTVSIHAAAPLLASLVLVAIQRLASTASQAHLIITVSRSRAPPQLILS